MEAIGIVVSGHGHFASGIMSDVELIIGKQENTVAVDFPYGTSIDDLRKALHAALDSLQHCEQILIATDLFHGSPFNEALMIALKQTRYDKILYGVNVAMLLTLFLDRNNGKIFTELINDCVQAGKEALGVFDVKTIVQEAEDDGF